MISSRLMFRSSILTPVLYLVPMVFKKVDMKQKVSYLFFGNFVKRKILKSYRNSKKVTSNINNRT